jgi:hypothetical protein
MIGYWGQTSSFACCAGISHAEPRQEECATPLRELDLHTPLGHFFSCLVSEFRHNVLAWEDIMPTLHTAKGPALLLDVYVWPLRLVRSDGRGRLFVRHALGEAAARRDGFLSRALEGLIVDCERHTCRNSIPTFSRCTSGKDDGLQREKTGINAPESSEEEAPLA